jgi:hypothetical protein
MGNGCSKLFVYFDADELAPVGYMLKLVVPGA